MVADGEDELICDFAQFYHVLSWRALPLSLAAVLAAGLPADARCKLRMSGLTEPLNTVLLARLSDQAETWLWAHSDKHKRAQKPVFILDTLLRREQEKPPIHVFRTGEEFRAAYQSWIRGD